MDLQVQLRELREQQKQGALRQSELIAIQEKEDRALNTDEQAEHDELIEKHGSLDQRAMNIERTLKVGAHSPDVSDDIGMTDGEARSFSIRKLVRAMSEPSNKRAQEEAAFEFECSDAVKEKRKTAPNGVYVPNEAFRRHQRATHTVSANVGSLVEDMLAEGEFIEILRNRSVLAAAGARQIPDLVGDFTIGKRTGSVTAQWQATEETDITESNTTLGTVTLSPKTLGAHASISRQGLLQTTPAIDRLIEDDMRAQVSLAMDLAGLYGTGSNGQPQGIQGTTGVNAPTDFAAAIPTWAELMAMVGAVAADNAITSLGGDQSLGGQRMVWLLAGELAANLMASEKFASTGMTIINDDGRIGSWEGYISNQITSGDVFFGDFSQVLIGSWGGVDLLVDPFSQSQKGVTRMTIFQTADVALRHPEAIAFNNDGA